MARPRNPSRRPAGSASRRSVAAPASAPEHPRSPKTVLLEVAGWFRPAALAEMHAALLRGELDAAADDAPAARPAGAPERVFDFRPVWVLVAAAILLTAMEYGGYSHNFRSWFPVAAEHPRWGELYGMLWWAGVRVTGFVILPMLFITVVLGRPLRAFGLTLRGASRHLPVYAVLFGIVAPLVLLFSQSERFRETYPFYRLAGRSLLDYALWEHAYIWQFFGVEFFFRGFLIHGLKRHLGAYSIAVSVVPYCMVHFGKPLPETLGSIIADTVLGVLSLRTRSIWAGFLVHISVAVMMDTLSVVQGLPEAATKFASLIGLPQG